MPKFIVGARLHDYGKGSPDELFGRVAADGFAAVQLAYKKCVPSVRSYADVTDALVAETVAAEKVHSIQAVSYTHLTGHAGDGKHHGHRRPVRRLLVQRPARASDRGCQDAQRKNQLCTGR